MKMTFALAALAGAFFTMLAAPAVAAEQNDLVGEWSGKAICFPSKGAGPVKADVKMAPKENGVYGTATFTGPSNGEIRFTAQLMTHEPTPEGIPIAFYNEQWVGNQNHKSRARLYGTLGNPTYMLLELDFPQWDCAPVRLKYIENTREPIIAEAKRWEALSPAQKAAEKLSEGQKASARDICKNGGIGPCLRNSAALVFYHRNPDVILPYIDALMNEAKGGEIFKSCADEIGLINESIDLISDLIDLKDLEKISTCDEAASIYEEIVGSQNPNYVCRSVTSAEDFVEGCLVEHPVDPFYGPSKLFKNLNVLGVPRERVWETYGLPMEHLAQSADSSSNLITTLKENFDQCKRGVPLDTQRSYLAGAYARSKAYNSVNPGEIDWRQRTRIGSEVTCKNLAVYLTKKGLIAKSAADEYIASTGGNAPTGACTPLAQTVAPVIDRIRAPVAAMALRQFCSKDSIVFPHGLSETMNEVRLTSDGCERSAAGLPIATYVTRFNSGECAIGASGSATCGGEVAVHCVAADSSREFIDCMGANVAVDARASFVFDKTSCDWKLDALAFVPGSQRIIEALK